MVKKLFLPLFLVIYFAAVYFLFGYFGISCVFLKFAGVPCPGCGMTRALFSLINGDLAGAAKFNVMIFFMPYVFSYIFFDFKHSAHKIILLSIGLLAIVNWIIKLTLFF